MRAKSAHGACAQDGLVSLPLHVHNRTTSKAQALAADFDAVVVGDLDQLAVRAADRACACESRVPPAPHRPRPVWPCPAVGSARALQPMGVVVSTLPSAAGFVLSGALLPPHSRPVVLEAAYVPGGTALAKQIAQLNLNQHSGGAGAGAATVGPLQMIVGLEMLFEQAAGQFEHWARVPFQRKVRQYLNHSAHWSAQSGDPA